MSAAAVLLAQLALAQLPFATGVELPSGERVDLAADHLTYDPEAQVITLRGHCVLRAGPVVVRADEVTYDQVQQRAVARGHVMLAMGLMAAVGEVVEVDVQSLEARIEGGLFMQKKNVTPEALQDAETPEQLKALGDSTIAFTGKRIQRLGPNRFAVDGLSFTPCDCKPTEPSWRIEAARADVEVGERATLTWPVVYVHGVPVLALPWAYLPLADRRTGFLVPRASATYLSGPMLEQPLFITLGDSYDLTLTPGYALGGGGELGIQGPRLSAELRYAPTDHRSGRALLGALYDLRPRRDPLNPSQPLPGRRGLRFEGVWQHTEDLGRGFQLRADLSGVSDGYYVKDLTADVLLRETQYLRSTAVLSRRADDQYAGLEVTLRQDTRFGYSLFDAGAPNTLHRLPALSYALLERPLFGPVSASLTAEYSRVAPSYAGTGDEGSDGELDPLAPDPDATQGNRRFDPGEREARDRLDLRPRLSARLRAGDLLRISPYLAYRQDVYVGEVTGRVAQRGYPMAGVAVDTQLSRTFSGGALRHTITPSLEVRSVPAVFGAPLGLYDELDAAVPQAGLLQAVAELSQRLLVREGGQVAELARLDLAQGVDLLERRLGDSSARASVRRGWFGADATARYSIPERRLTQLAAGLNLDDGKGRRAYARYERLTLDGSERQRRGADALVGPALQPITMDWAELLTAGALYRFPFGLAIGYDAIAQPSQLASATPLNTLTQQTLTAGYSPSCDCWRTDVSMSLTRTPNGEWQPGWGIRFSLAGFGTLGR